MSGVLNLGLGMDGPITRREIENLLVAVTTLPGDKRWLKAQDYRRLLGIGPTRFWELKKLGRFDGGTDPATLGLSHIRIHAWWNPTLQRFVAPAIRRGTVTHKQRGKYGKKDKEGTAGGTGGTGGRVRKEQHAAHPQRRSENEAGQYMPGSEERPQA